MARKHHAFGVEFAYRNFTYNPRTGEVTRIDGHKEFVNCSGYKQIFCGGRLYLCHRIAFAMGRFCYPDGEVDHINGDRADNRFWNLRLVSSQAQNMNRRLGSRNSSGVKGVCWESSRKRWRATIGTRLVGRFEQLHEAESAVKRARNQFHGEYANHG
jgi:hypothetical protein